MSAPRLHYAVGLTRCATHHVDVTLRVDDVHGDLELWLPAWTPGSYMIREFARNLRAPRARASDGAEPRVERIDKATLLVRGGRGTIELSYRVYANEVSVRTTWVDAERALLNGASTYLIPRGREHEPIALSIDVPSSWRVFTALPRTSDGTWLASDHDRLVDSPIACGAFDERSFDVDGVRHAFAFCGRGNWEPEKVERAAAAIVAENARVFGSLPYANYAFLAFTTAEGRGGLEHRDSCVLLHPRLQFDEPVGWHDFVTLIAHEHFHSWNVKWARPAELAAADLRAETYTRSLWIAEGVTSYYDELTPLRAGVMARAVYLQRIADAITRYRETPGRACETLEDASLLAWVRLYRPDEDSPNSGVSYYAKGALVALLLDLEIRTRSADRATLDHVMAAFVREFPPQGRGYRGHDFERICSAAAGADLTAFFDRAVRSTAELEFEAPLARFGLALRDKPKDKPTARDLIGARVRRVERRTVIDGIDPDSPAELAGLSARDELIALDGLRVDADTLAQRLRAVPVGRGATFALLRDDVLIERSVVLTRGPASSVVLTAIDDVDAATRARRDAWLRGA
ncbi:MAG: M61 family metallopeptidase [Planctomycetes bacterium]|nr:M61 family metallopeptidase [Planctomycetota bacterium]